MRALFIAFLLALSGAASAEVIGFHVASRHWPQRAYNNFNPGAYVRADNGITAGVYLNSHERVSFYAGWTWERGPLAVTLGGVTGYRETIRPMVVPSLRVGSVAGLDVRLAYLPRFDKRGAQVLHLMVELP